MLSIYRRHKSKCSQADDRMSKKCRCALWVVGTVEGEAVRESLKTRNWERAEQLKRAREANVVPVEKKPVVTVERALEKYYEASEARQLAQKTLSKYRTLKTILTDFAERHSIAQLDDFDQQQVRKLIAERKLSAITAGKEIERIRTFFSFCLQNDWLQKNPAKFVKPPRSKQIPRLPFSDDEVARISAQTRDDRELAFILTLRHTGLRIGDAALLRAAHLQGNRIHLRTTKAGTHVSIVVPPQLQTLLEAIKPTGGYFFLLGDSTHPHSTSDGWRKRIKRMCEDAKISPDHPHRFRHTLAADLLMKGVSVEDVAAILGNTPGVVVKHYSQWIKGRQDRLDAIIESTWQPKLLRVK